MRNLIVGYVTADQAKRPEILRYIAIFQLQYSIADRLSCLDFLLDFIFSIILHIRIVATVLDFSQEERGIEHSLIQLLSFPGSIF